MAYSKNQEELDFISIGFQIILVYLPLGKLFPLFLLSVKWQHVAFPVATAGEQRGAN